MANEIRLPDREKRLNPFEVEHLVVEAARRRKAFVVLIDGKPHRITVELAKEHSNG